MKIKLIQKTHKSFTLIEMMVVVLIIMTLASLVTVQASNARKKGRDAKRIADVNIVATALQSYYADNHHYPIGSSYIAECFDYPFCWYPGSKNQYVDVVKILKDGGYLQSCPTDPSFHPADPCVRFYGSAPYSNYLRTTPQPLDQGYRYTCVKSAALDLPTNEGECQIYYLGTDLETSPTSRTGVNASNCDCNGTPTICKPEGSQYVVINGEPESFKTCP